MKVDGNHILEVCRGRNDIPPKYVMRDAARRHGYNEVTFRMAVRDWWDGLWAESRFRSESCGLTGHEVDRPSMIEAKRKVDDRVDLSDRAGRMSKYAISQKANFTLASIMQEQGCVCPCCGEDLIAVDDYHLDHIMPVCLGGCNEYWNLQFLCRPCNLRKSGDNPFFWAAQTGTKLPEKFLSRFEDSA